MKKADLAVMVNEMIGGTKSQSENVVNSLFDTIANAMAKGDDVDISGFGKFQGVMRAARDARNPRSGETVKVLAHRAPKFKAAKGLKDRIHG